MDAKADISVDVDVSANLRRLPYPSDQIDCTVDLATDADIRRAIALTAGVPPEDEGLYCGAMEDDFSEGGGGGTTVIDSGLGDVEINNSTLQDGDVLIWDATLGAWTNSDTGGGGGASDGFELPLGDIAVHGDGSWSPGAVPLTNTTPVSEAVDRLNEVLAKLVPSPPTDFPNGTLTLANGAGSSPRLATGVTDNTAGASGYTAGSAVNRITAAGFSSGGFNDVGPGESGTINAYLNGVIAASHVLTGSGDNGSYSGLVISDQKDYPVSTPGFWKSIDVALNLLAALVGINSVSAEHTAAGATNTVYFVRDGMTSAPAVSSPALVQASAGTLSYSSSVPHYGTGATLTVDCSINNLSGETYYGGSDPLTVSGTNGILSAQSFSYANLGITTPIARQNTGVTAITSVTVSVNGSTHGAGVVQATARNVNGASGATSLSSKTVLVKNGSAGGKIDENSVTVSGLGSSPNANNAVRVGLGSGDTPSGTPAAWVSSDALATHETAVVAGVLKHDQTDYSANYLPTGPDLSAGRSGAQYVTFSFKRTARSGFKINVTGAYAACWVKLPGVSDVVAPNAPNGWWNGFKPYDGAGVPGEVGDTDAGCAAGAVMTGGSGSFSITFGTQSSTNATDNEILVRFKLTSGQSITALSLTN